MNQFMELGDLLLGLMSAASERDTAFQKPRCKSKAVEDR